VVTNGGTSGSADQKAFTPDLSQAERFSQEGSDGDSSAEHRVVSYLRSLGIAEERIRKAQAEGSLDVLALEAILLPPGPRYSLEEAARATGIPGDIGIRIWRSLGFPEPRSLDETILTDEDVEMLAVAKRYLDRGVDPELLVQFVRTLGFSLSRIADAEIAAVGAMGEGLLGREISERMASRAAERPVEEVFAEVVRERVSEMARLLDYGHRRHLIFAARREINWQPGSRAGVEAGVVGFADMVGFTAMSQQLDAVELAVTVEKFGSLASDVVGMEGGRVIKMIGDEVMFVFEEAADAARAALDLADAYSADRDLSTVRVGLASGDLLVLDGDYYGPVVNLASRIVNIALPGTVVVSESMRDELDGREEFELKPVRPRRLKGIGVVRLWVLRRRGSQQRGITAQDLRQIGAQAVAEILGEGI